jgi:hypothetical protein
MVEPTGEGARMNVEAAAAAPLCTSDAAAEDVGIGTVAVAVLVLVEYNVVVWSLSLPTAAAGEVAGSVTVEVMKLVEVLVDVEQSSSPLALACWAATVDAAAGKTDGCPVVLAALPQFAHRVLPFAGAGSDTLLGSGGVRFWPWFGGPLKFLELHASSMALHLFSQILQFLPPVGGAWA